MHKSNRRFLYNLTVDKNHLLVYDNGEVIKMARPKKEDKQNPTDYKRDFNQRAYDRLSPYVKKGKKEVYQAAAKKAGYSLNEFMERAMDEMAEKLLGE